MRLHTSSNNLLTSAIFAALFLNAVAEKEFADIGQTGNYDETRKVLSPLLSTLVVPDTTTYLPLREDHNSEFKVVCYLGNSEYDPNKINIDLCSHIVYIYVAILDEDKLLIKPREIPPGLYFF